MMTPQRYPYAGQLVFTAFAGTHQDAIKKGLESQRKRWEKVDQTGEGIKYWSVPYIPLDPKDLGYGYENLIRVSSQSGKAGAAYIIKETMGIDLPRRMQVAFYKAVQHESERTQREMTVNLLKDVFHTTFGLTPSPSDRLALRSVDLRPLSPSTASSDDSEEPNSAADESYVSLNAQIEVDGKSRHIQGKGRGPVAALRDALQSHLDLELTVGESHVQNCDGGIAAILDVSSASSSKSAWGVGISGDVVDARCYALIGAANQLIAADAVFPRAKMVYAARNLPGVPTPQEGYFPDLRAGHSLVPSRPTTPVSMRGVEAS